MTDGELLCNFKKCRKIITGIAYITRCSHAFCEDDGIKQIESQHFEKKCPACQSPLVKNYDLVKVTLNPNDQFKSMVLAGLRPETVMDIATRAIMFWSYQQHQEQLHQSHVTKNLKDIINQMKTDSEMEVAVLKTEIQILKKKQEDLEKEIEKQNKKCNELSEKLTLRTRESQKWQIMYESLKRKQLTNAVMQTETEKFERNAIALNVGPQTMDEFLPNRGKAIQIYKGTTIQEGSVVVRQKKSPAKTPKDGFVFQPRPMGHYMSPKVFLENATNNRFQTQKKN